MLFTFVISYTDAACDTAWPAGVHDKLLASLEDSG
jgi:hypothetical protein